jgi:1-deoxy-D-xylulose-5-phosphate reductoisomerase
MSKRLAILGSTGSIGTNTLKVVAAHADRLQVTGLAAGRQGDMLAAQARSCAPSWVYAASPDALAGKDIPPHCRVLTSPDELVAAVCADDVDTVLCAIVGTAGLRPVLEAIKAGKDIALASKEILVMAGALVSAAPPNPQPHPAGGQRTLRRLPMPGSAPATRTHTRHPHGQRRPFHNRPEVDLSRVSVDQALAHPTWSMGRKLPSTRRRS